MGYTYYCTVAQALSTAGNGSLRNGSHFSVVADAILAQSFRQRTTELLRHGDRRESRENPRS